MLFLFSQRIEPKPSHAEQTVTLLKADCRLFANLYIACKSKGGDLENFFDHQNHAFHVSLSEYGKLRNCVKSDFIDCLQNLKESLLDPPDVQAIVVDEAALVHSNYPEKKMKTYDVYCEQQITEEISDMGKNVKRVGVVFDVYKVMSLKQETREGRSKGDALRTLVRYNTPIQHSKFQKFLQVNDNKTELFELIANCVVEQCTEPAVIATNDEKVVSNRGIRSTGLQPCNQEEAGTRILLYVQAIFGKVMIVANGTDVVVISLNTFIDLGIDEFWIEYGSGKHRLWLRIHTYVSVLGEEMCQALQFWYGLTGRDSVSAFAGRGKKTAWETWNCFPEARSCFFRYCMFKALSLITIRH